MNTHAQTTKTNTSLIVASLLVAVLAAVSAGAGLFWPTDGAPFSFTTLRGSEVEIYGSGLYRYDAAFRAPIFRGTDAVTLLICVPALVITTLWTRRGSLRGRLLLTGLLSYFLYYSASLAFGVAFNQLILVYIASFSVSLFAFVSAFSTFSLEEVANFTSARFPRRAVSIFLFVAGASLIVWLIDIVSALANGRIPPHIEPYTTEVTYVIDLAIILPGAIIAGVLNWKRSGQGTLLAVVFLTLNMLIGLVVIGQSILQAAEGIRLSPAEFGAYVVPFVLLSLIALGFLVTILRSLGRGSNP